MFRANLYISRSNGSKIRFSSNLCPNLTDTKKQAKQGTIPIEDIRSDFRAKRSLLLLTNADIKQEESLLPTEIDSEEVTREKIAYLKDLTKQQYHNAVNK